MPSFPCLPSRSGPGQPCRRNARTRSWAASCSLASGSPAIRSHGGDGLGPVFNERSCLGCHHQGGPGGGAGADHNIEIVTATSDDVPDFGAFYSFGMSFGAGGFQYRFASNSNQDATRRRPERLNLANLVQVHAGFRDVPSVVLHRFGPDAGYRRWRETVPGRHGEIIVRPSQRNATPPFGIGLIVGFPDAAIEAAARRKFAGWPQVKGRVSRLPDGRVGRFGWKANGYPRRVCPIGGVRRVGSRGPRPEPGQRPEESRRSWPQASI